MGEEYLEVEPPKIENQVYFKSYREFEKAVEGMKPEIKCTWSLKTGQVIGFIREEVLYCFTIPRHFPSVEEYIRAEGEGFKGDHAEWAEIKDLMGKGGYGSYRELESERGDLLREEWVALKKLGFRNAGEVREAEKMGFIYLGQRVFGHAGKCPPAWWGNFTAGELDAFREAKRAGFKSKTEFMGAKR